MVAVLAAYPNPLDLANSWADDPNDVRIRLDDTEAFKVWWERQGD